MHYRVKPYRCCGTVLRSENLQWLIQRWRTRSSDSNNPPLLFHATFQYQCGAPPCCIFVFIYGSSGRSMYLYACLSVNFSIPLSISLSIYLFIYPLLQFSLCESEMTERSHCWTERPMLSLTLVYLSIYLSSCLPVYLWCSCTCRVVSLCTCSCRCSWSGATSAPPKVVRNPTVFNILTSKYASRHNGVRFFETPHLSLQKWSEPLVFCTFWLRNVLRATTACTFSKLDLWASKSGPNP